MRTLKHPATFSSVRLRVWGLRPDLQPRWGKMSAHQMVCHLSDAFLVAMGRLQVKNVESSGLKRAFMKSGALYLPVRWPQGIQTVPEIEQGCGGTPPSEFERDRARLIGLIEEFSQKMEDWQINHHPFFGRMSVWQWQRWGFLHTDHHLRQFGV